MNAMLERDRAGLASVVAGFGRLGCACAALLVMGNAPALADQITFKFCNSNKEQASDLHIEFIGKVKFGEGNAVPKQDPSDTFEDAKGDGTDTVDLAKGAGNGKGVAPGGCVVLTFEFVPDENGDEPSVNWARWTDGNTLSPGGNADPAKDDWLGEALKRDEVKNAWVDVPATGDGVLLVTIAGEAPMKFAPTAGDTGEATASKFAEFVAGLPFGKVLCAEGRQVVSTARVLGSVEPGITVEVLQKDSTQAVEITPLPVFGSGFEAARYKGGPDGVPVDGFDGWYPMEEFALSAQVFTYLPNEPGFGRLPGGGDQFLVAACGKDGPAGAQRDAAFSEERCGDGYLSISYDTTSRFVGEVPPDGLAEFIGGFALAPAPKSRYFVQMNTWADKKGGAWSAGYQVAAEPPGSPVDPSVVVFAGPEWQNISADTWVRIETTVSFAENRIVRIAITDVETGERTEFEPADWYLEGGSVTDRPLPGAVRLFSQGDAGNHTGWDNFDQDYEQVTFAFCYPDFTGEGELDLFDFLAYVNAFNNGEKIANCDEEDGLTLFDFLCFVNAFNVGC